MELIAWVALAAGTDWEAEEALTRFKAARRSADPQARALAVSELGKFPHDKTYAKLVGLLGSEDRALRISSARTLGEFKDWRKGAVPALLAAFQAHAKDPEMQAATMASLGRLGDEAALPRIHAAFRGPDARVAQAAIEATGVLRSASSMEPLLALMKELARHMERKSPGGYEGPNGVGEEGEQQTRLKALYDAAIKSVQSIAKDSWTTHQEWEVWWKRRKATFKVEK